MADQCCGLRSMLLIQTSGTTAAYCSPVQPRDMISRKYSGAFIDHNRLATLSSSTLSVSTDAPSHSDDLCDKGANPDLPDGCTSLRVDLASYAPVPAADPVSDQAAVLLRRFLPGEVACLQRVDLTVRQKVAEVLVV